MKKSSITILCCWLMLLLAACSKDKTATALPDGSLSIGLQAGKDSVVTPLSILKDSVVVISSSASLAGTPSTADHWLDFGVDTTRIIAYRAKYGAAVLLPSNTYLFFKPQVRLPAGTSVSDPLQLNLILQTKLDEFTTYVLPVVIKAVDGKATTPDTSNVLYYVFNTGRSAIIKKTGWTIAAVSSVYSTFAAANVLDDNKATYWTSSITQAMPQSITINFNRNIDFSAVTYSVPAILGYPKSGGYPTSIQIETSMDGTVWVNKGTFDGNIQNNIQTITIGATTARYVRFTSLASVKYSSTYSAIFISDISLLL